MFEGPFADGSAVKSYRTARLLEERLRYIEHLSQTGAAPAHREPGSKSND